MTMGVSNLGTLSLLTFIMQNNDTQLNTLGTELSSGQASQSLSGYGPQAQPVLNLNATIAAANAYVSTSTTVSTYLSGTDTSLTELIKDANQLSKGLTDLSTNAGSFSVTALTGLVSGLGLDVTTTLNTQVGNRYIFAGTRYNTPPVLDINSLPAPGAPTAFAAVTSPLLPAYDTDAAANPGGEASAWAQSTATIAASETISYGVSSNDTPIQQLVYALQNAAAATNSSGATQAQYVSLAQDAVQQAIAGLQNLQAKNGAVMSQVNNTQTAQKQSVATLTGMLNGITGVDTTKVSVQIASLQTQMQASYRVTSTLLNLSLANYLSGSGAA
ncbi:MAG TPA: flagellin [Stellaceae bacterium]|nr:flagellin [Stellaceae bacterium]